MPASVTDPTLSMLNLKDDQDDGSIEYGSGAFRTTSGLGTRSLKQGLPLILSTQCMVIINGRSDISAWPTCNTELELWISSFASALAPAIVQRRAGKTTAALFECAEYLVKEAG